MPVRYLWRGDFTNVEVNRLHSEAFGTRVVDEAEWNWQEADAGRQGIGTQLLAVARDHARDAGCEWLHVDFDDHLRPFYFDSCGFTPTNAGLIALQ